jgi:hypothetical protein
MVGDAARGSTNASLINDLRAGEIDAQDFSVPSQRDMHPPIGVRHRSTWIRTARQGNLSDRPAP